jgi:hypothetical protein
MKQDILKIAGVKSEAEFYKKFPTEEAFQKAFPKQFKKAKMGAAMVKKQLTQLTDFANPPQAQVGIQQFGLQKPNFNYDVAAANKQMFGGYDFNKGLINQYTPQVSPGQFANRTRNEVSASVYDTTGMPKYANSIGKSQTPAAPKDPSAFSSVLNNAGEIYQGFEQAKQDRQNLLKSKQFNELSKIGLAATQSRPERIKNKYVRPEDMMFDPNQMYPSYGTNANVLAKDGKKVRGNKTEIQNTYAPGSLYDNLGYEPLNDSAQNGGFFGNWQGDVRGFGEEGAGGLGTMFGSAIGGGHGRPSGASKIGGGIGSVAGNIVGGPLGGVIGKGIGSFVGGIAGGAQQRRTQNFNKLGMDNVKQAAFQSGMQGMQQNQFGAFMEDGGWVSNDWQPQTITKFGEYDVKDLLKEDPTMDTLRAGGHLKSYTAPSEEAMQTYGMGGNLQVDDRGDIDFMGYNPETAKTGASGYVGITRGPSHDNGGFNIDYGGNKVEAEGGETVIEKKDGGSVDGENALNILGNMKIGNYGEEIIDDVNKQTLNKLLKGRKIKDVKFKHLGNNIAKKTKSLNKHQEKYVNMVDSADEDDLLALSTAQAGLTGIQMQYKDLNNLQTSLIDLQNIYHDTAKENGYEDTPKFLEDVKKGDLKNQAAIGAKLTKAQFGTSTGKRTNNPLADYLIKGLGPLVNLDFQIPTNADFTPQASSTTDSSSSSSSKSTKKSSGKSKAPAQQLKDLPTTPYVSPLDSRWNKYLPKGGETIPTPYRSVKDATEGKKKVDAMKSKKDTVTTATKNRKFDYVNFLRELQPYLTPSNQEPLDPNQFAGEMLALATNQLQPVQAQSYIPQLETPYSISFQDQMNANQADFNAMQRQLGANPAALAQLAAQKYGANSGILGQQARANQELQMGAYNRNRATLNDAFLKNLAINDQQFQRQEQARSNTKMQAQAALNSMSDKIARHRLENRTLGIQENMYNYRFGPKGRAINVNAPYEFNVDLASLTPEELETAKKYKELQEKKGVKKDESMARNGSIVKAIKNL